MTPIVWILWLQLSSGWAPTFSFLDFATCQALQDKANDKALTNPDPKAAIYYCYPSTFDPRERKQS